MPEASLGAASNGLVTQSRTYVYDTVNSVWVALRQGAGANQVLVDVADRAARLVGIVYGEVAQLQQVTPADSLSPANSLEVSGFPHVYDADADDWNRLREGDGVGSALVDLYSPSTISTGQFTVTAARLQLTAVDTPIKSVTIENVSTNDVVYVGDDTLTAANGYALRAGATVSLDIDNLNKVYVLGTADDIITYIVVN